MLHVIVTMKIKPGRMEEFLAVCRDLRPQVLREPGCHGYDYTRDAAPPRGEQPLDPDRVTLLERWESREALQTHLATPHLREAGTRMADLRAAVEIRCTEDIF